MTEIEFGMRAFRFALAVGIEQLGWQQQHQVIEKLSQCSSCQRKGDCSGLHPAWDHQPEQSSWQIGFPIGFENVGRPWCWGSTAYWTWDTTISSCGRFFSSQFDHGHRLFIYHRNAQRLINIRKVIAWARCPEYAFVFDKFQTNFGFRVSGSVSTLPISSDVFSMCMLHYESCEG